MIFYRTKIYLRIHHIFCVFNISTYIYTRKKNSILDQRSKNLFWERLITKNAFFFFYLKNKKLFLSMVPKHSKKVLIYENDLCWRNVEMQSGCFIGETSETKSIQATCYCFGITHQTRQLSNTHHRLEDPYTLRRHGWNIRESQELSWRNLSAMGCLASDSLSGSKTSVISPSTSRHTLSAILCICLMLWDTITIVIPRLFFSFTITSSMFCVDIGSNALVGSSNNKTYKENKISGPLN